jgi:hypothetical protein
MEQEKVPTKKQRKNPILIVEKELVPCVVCGDDTYSKYNLCTGCFDEIEREMD